MPRSYQLSHTLSLEGAPSEVPGDNHLSSTIGFPGRANALQAIVRSRLFLLVTALAVVGYIAFFKYLDLVTATPVMAAPSYFVLFYALIAVSSFSMGLNVYSVRFRLARRTVKSGAAGGSTSAGASLFGGVISCSCHTSLLLPVLTSMGAGVASGIGIITALVVYQVWILAFFIVLNLYLAYLILGKIHPVEP